MTQPTPRTLYDKIWDAHVVRSKEGLRCTCFDREVELLVHPSTRRALPK